MKRYSAVLFILLFLVSCTERQDEQSERDSLSQDSLRSTILTKNADSFERDASSIGQIVYVPVYSHIYQQNRKTTFNLTTTLSIRNADPYRSFTLAEVSYFDSKGNLIQQYLDTSQVVKPLASTSFVVEEKDLRGGVGANFIVNWESEEPIIPPVIEAVNISTSQQQGVSFLSVGRVLLEHSSNETSNN